MVGSITSIACGLVIAGTRSFPITAMIFLIVSRRGYFQGKELFSNSLEK
ncbi:hypothetical protein DCF50_p1601 [Dehalobacter sp. CF]|nr:hypothetical protein DCF50_p1601 [Dehalobacter sp. CF]